MTAGFGALYRRRLAVALNNPIAITGQLLLPVLWVLVVGPALARAFGGFSHVDYFTYIAIGQIVFIIPFSAMFAGLVVIQDRHFGILRELLVAPIRRSVIPMANVATVLTVAMGQLTLVVILSLIRGAHLHVAPGRLVLGVAAAALLSIATYGLAELLAYRITQPQIFGTLIPAIGATPYALCGAIYPLATLPAGVQAVRVRAALDACRGGPAIRTDGRFRVRPARDLALAFQRRDGRAQHCRTGGVRGAHRRACAPSVRTGDARLSERSAALDDASKVAVIARKLTRDDPGHDRLQQLHHATELPVGDKVHPRAVAGGLERPRPVHRELPLDDVHAHEARTVELGEFRDLLKLPAHGRLQALTEPRAEARRPVGELLRRGVCRLPIGEVGRVRHVIEHDLGRSGDGEDLLDVHPRGVPAAVRTVNGQTALRVAAENVRAPPEFCPAARVCTDERLRW